jgi:hypothetical protein
MHCEKLREVRCSRWPTKFWHFFSMQLGLAFCCGSAMSPARHSFLLWCTESEGGLSKEFDFAELGKAMVSFHLLPTVRCQHHAWSEPRRYAHAQMSTDNKMLEKL